MSESGSTTSAARGRHARLSGEVFSGQWAASSRQWATGNGQEVTAFTLPNGQMRLGVNG